VEPGRHLARVGQPLWPVPKVTGQALFGLVVKTVGLIVVLYGLELFVAELLLAAKAPARQSRVVFSVLEIVVGLVMVRGVVAG
jgi:hypothetical protein